MIEREKQIQEILNFISRHKNSLASLTVCSRVLGDEFLGIDEDTIGDLRSRLFDIGSDELEGYYYIIK